MQSEELTSILIPLHEVPLLPSAQIEATLQQLRPLLASLAAEGGGACMILFLSLSLVGIGISDLSPARAVA